MWLLVCKDLVWNLAPGGSWSRIISIHSPAIYQFQIQIKVSLWGHSSTMKRWQMCTEVLWKPTELSPQITAIKLRQQSFNSWVFHGILLCTTDDVYSTHWKTNLVEHAINQKIPYLKPSGINQSMSTHCTRTLCPSLSGPLGSQNKETE